MVEQVTFERQSGGAASTVTSGLAFEPMTLDRVRLRIRRTKSSAELYRASTFRRSTRACQERWKTASSPAIRWSDVRATLKDGSYHDVDSTEMAFKIAGVHGAARRRPGRRAGSARAGHAVEVVTPEDYMGDVMGDLNRRRGLPQGMDEVAGGQRLFGRGAAGGNVRLFDGPAFDDAGPRHLHDGVREIRGSAELDADDIRRA